ncbi:copper-transporting P-type ATPase ActP [Octadecabacter antarcticus 307]|uniref:P-type Cu(+) transporter n=1 Tax=Octadecabacter antarcticus 307 TaxID=391626 RepID=M9RBR3_9RHOB|nr:heavy metal translocating P-type ATPase [Octadecabacter antarcticus]AGI69617.1 copper-transporting P-type ATPase ActP [Octadecabacter antarcticus 307]
MTTSHRLSLSGMTCASCVGRAEKVISKIDGVTDVSVNLATETATFSSDTITLPEVAERLSAAGYPARQTTTRLQVNGMTCASCVGRVERMLKSQTGVLDASVNLATQTASVMFLDGAIKPEDLARAVTAAGYETIVPQANDAHNDRKEQEEQALYRATLMAGLLTFPVFLIEMGSHFIPGMHMWVERTIGTQNSWMFQFIVISIVMAGPGWRFYKKGLPALLRGAPDMNSLVALGTLAAWTFSTLALFAPSIFPAGTAAVYFEAAGVIVTLILLGRLLEARAKGRTGAAIQRLVDLQPATALVERGGEIIELALSEVVNGDIVHLRPGARVATDGTVVGGQTFIDESMISGEPVPVSKEAGDVVVGGTINGTGALTFRATAVGADTVLSQIIVMVENAQGAKLPIQSMVDRITGVFVPIVMGLSAATVLTWLIFGPDPALGLALVAGVSVLIIACPCAMGLATPTSIMVGTGRAAEMGVLFRKGDALQSLQESKVIALDKTGTLTAGAPELTTLDTVSGWTRETALPLIAALEAQSEHPIASAIVRAAAGYDLPDVTGFTSITGLGVRGIANGKTVLVGADRFMTQEGVDLGEYAQSADALAQTGATPLFAAINGQIAAVIGVSDPIKPTTADAISALHSMGLKVAMITGDNTVTAHAIARELGIEHVVAEVMPDGKVAAVQSLRDRYGKVAFVGDGINDAPALAAADTGIAIGTGTDVAIEAADVVLMSGDLVGAVNALKISQASMRNIRQNLFWAFAYNAALLPVAAGVFYPITGTLLSPMLAAGAMALSSVFVVSNALRLRRVTPALTDTNVLSQTSILSPIGATS